MKKNNKVFVIEFQRASDGSWRLDAIYDDLLKFIADIDKVFKKSKLIPATMRPQDYIELSTIDGVNYIFINRFMIKYRYKLVKLNKL